MLVIRPLPAGIDFLAVHRLDPQRYPLLLESSATGSAQGRWDILLASSGEALRLDADGVTRDRGGANVDGDFLAVLDRHWRAHASGDAPTEWPFRGGWAL